jgi:hypothetical protein
MKKNELEKRIEKELRALEPVPSRDPRAVESGRARFQLEADQILLHSLKAVSKRQEERPKGWIFARSEKTFQRKGMTQMAKLALSIFLALTTVFTATGVTMVAAQASQPDEALYPLKVWTEDVRLNLAGNDPEALLSLALEFADRRVAEINTMAGQGKAAPDSVLARWQKDISYAYQALIKMQGEAFGQDLARVEATLRVQLESMQQAGSNAQTEALLTRSRTMIEEHLRLMTGSGGEQQQIQEQLQLQLQDQQQINQPEGAGNPDNGATNGQGTGVGTENNPGQPEAGIQGPQLGQDPYQWCHDYMVQLGYGTGAGMGPGMGPGMGSTIDTGAGAGYWYMYCQSLLTATPQPAGGTGNGNGGGGRP